MKTLVFLIFGILSVSAFDIPRHVYSINELDEAKAEALEKSKPVVFVYTDPGTT